MFTALFFLYGRPGEPGNICLALSSPRSRALIQYKLNFRVFAGVFTSVFLK